MLCYCKNYNLIDGIFVTIDILIELYYYYYYNWLDLSFKILLTVLLLRKLQDL